MSDRGARSSAAAAHLVAVPLLATALAAGCTAGEGAARPPRPSVKAGEFGRASCFVPHLARDFETLDDRNLIIFAPGKSDAYHVRVSPPDGRLRSTVRLAFESSGSQVCGYAGDALIIADPGSPPRRLSVTGVYRLDTAALQGLETRFGRRAVPGAPTPLPGKGAEIEPLDPQP